MDSLMRKEIQEAIAAGETALRSLREAENFLNSSLNWGFVDLIGGGLFTDLMKHSKMNKASSCMERAKTNLRIFQRELRDVSAVVDFRIDIGGFLTFADFFFDGIIADYLVQSKLKDAKAQVISAIHQVEALLRELRTYH